MESVSGYGDDVWEIANLLQINFLLKSDYFMTADEHLFYQTGAYNGGSDI